MKLKVKVKVKVHKSKPNSRQKNQIKLKLRGIRRKKSYKISNLLMNYNVIYARSSFHQKQNFLTMLTHLNIKLENHLNEIN